MLLTSLLTVLMAGALCFAPGWLVAARLALSATEKLLAAVVLSLLANYLVAAVVYVAHLPAACLWLLPAAGALGVFARRREFVALWRDAQVQQLAAAQLIVSAACVAWLATIENYSGGGWAADWFEHWERARFFLERWPLDAQFIGRYALTARPPLANIITAAWLTLTAVDFAHYQLLTGFFSSLAFLPAAVLASRWGGARAVAGLAVLVLVSPLFVQNATFAWTKLPAALFVLAALHFFLRTREAETSRCVGPLCAASLSAGLLTHYSSGPYAVAIAGAWLAIGHRRRWAPQWRRQTLTMAALGTALLATWCGWAIATYGVRGTLLTNSSVTSSDARAGNQLVKIGLNVFDTLVPHFLRTLDASLIAQRSPWGYVRDWWFQSYQLNLFFAFGVVAWIVISRELSRVARTERVDRGFWLGFVGTVVLLGIAVHGPRDHWGLAHICLQPLVLLGLAFLAARWAHLERPWRLLVIAGAAFDFLLGIALHFGVQNFALDRWFAPNRPIEDTLTSYNESAVLNIQAKIHHQLLFLSDRLGVPFGLWLAAAVLLLTIAIVRTQGLPPRDCDASSEPATGEPTTAIMQHERWLALLAIVTAACAIGHLWFGWCLFPVPNWNESRLAPSFALRHGVPLYVPLGGGPMSTWIYGPVGVLVNLPATFASSVVTAIETAGTINLLVLLAPLAVVCLSAPELRGLKWSAKVCALAMLALSLPVNTLTYQVADHSAIALGLLSCWILTRQRERAKSAYALSAALCVASIWAKQHSIFVPLAQILFLWLEAGRSNAWRYTAWVAVLGFFSVIANALCFGLGNLWLNLVVIPGRLPVVNVAAKALTVLPSLLTYVALPLAVVMALRTWRIWPRRDSATGGLLRCTIAVGLAVLPIGMLALFKIGGAVNALHSWYYLLGPITIVVISAGWRHPKALLWLTAVVIVLCGLRLSELATLPIRPHTSHLVAAERLAAQGRGTIWFPNNPLVTFYTDGRLYHDEDAIKTRSLARFGLPELNPRYLPAPLSAIAYDAVQSEKLALQLFPAYTQRTAIDGWAVYRREPAR